MFVHLVEHEPATSHSIAQALTLDLDTLDVLLHYLSRVGRILTVDDQGFSFTRFGWAVIERYSRIEGATRVINFFNTRVGAFGIVWSSLDKMLQGAFVYGRDFKRDGAEAQLALYRSSIHFLPRINEVIRDVAPACTVELGVGSGLSDRIKEAHPTMHVMGVDKNLDAFEDTRARSPHLEFHFVQSQVEDVATWAAQVPTPSRTLIVSIHFHEFLGGMSPEALPAMLAALRTDFAGSHLLVLEQPDLGLAERDRTPTVEWLHAQSNALIHNVIANGRILNHAAWVQLFTRNGLRLLATKSTGFIGYESFLFQL